MSRISILDHDRCQPKKCNYTCIEYCPGVRMEEDTIIIDEKTKKPLISEELCSGCGICTNRCPFNAISVINLPEALDNPIHRFGQNMFELFGLPTLSEGSVIGILGPNGIGKSTIMRILSGEMIPNLGNWENPANNWDEIIDHYKGSQLQSYFKNLSEGKIKVIHKPQMVDQLPKFVKGNVSELLSNADERNKFEEVIETLDLKNVLNREIANLSGGELQRVAIAASYVREGDFYYFDEPTSWLDVRQRLNAVKVIRSLAEDGKSVMVIEHDLATLDAISDYVNILYGQTGAYGVVSQMKGVRVGINAYINGFLKEENVRIRKQPIEFSIRPPTPEDEGESIVSYTNLKKSYEGFSLTAESGEIFHDEIVTAFGSNGIGKTTFAKILANEVKPDEGKVEEDIKIAYKPQYIVSDFEGRVEDFLYMNAPSYGSNIFKTEIMKPFSLEDILDKQVNELSGGELQRLAVATTLSKEADIYLFDEPTAFLDVEQRLVAGKAIRKIIESKNAASLIVDHDIVFIDYISDRAMVFQGDPGIKGKASKPMDLRTSMNKFLKDLKITFRRDKETKRPRVNKLDSYLDREQKENGEYYYLKDK
ncbi:ribosome biogenesis/translation initiation ATPase RLI [Methanobrevibacter arboriphilus]|uniref:Ribosome biogenesis/translation initiation ATPase RLI n=1 Tax=Methanobrevibacter arboriphilus TaxID=39441 RepID=A0ACA8R2K7_METAZ|nr:ribosome biogenesis/translation initiation ATPase RLI [Methanobrevibacter arboriphilus]MCC7562564.1 ribosome biogenesis/translation initiation ATPase RLI [Methanobrevibacter arboriphilus]BBL61858.1 ribosome biogenesis/translation initiation ATPase RLI [Methanobrevibacter arboriphilus]GLI10970.1 ribosome biogenesis/translation initiation ATPase RLI [Methanobrevibacter arboriphilus]